MFGKKKPNQERGNTIGQLVMATASVPDQVGKELRNAKERPSTNGPRKSSLSTQSESSFTTQSGSSLFENSRTRSSSEGSSISSVASPKQGVDPNIAVFSGVRHDRVEDLTRRVTVASNRAFFEGNYSNVWTGTLDDAQVVAIKGLKDKQIRPQKAQRRFKREVGTWWCLRHENVAPLLGLVYDDTFGTSGAMVSPWYTNGSAHDYLLKHTVSIEGRIDLFYGVAKGLHYLHTFDTTKITEEPATGTEPESNIRVTGIVHGDLKPLNVLVDDKGVAKLCDFGLLHLIRGSVETGVTTTSSHTGTTRYLCYELVAEEEGSDKELIPTTASDVHALASVGLEFVYSIQPYANIHSPNRLDYQLAKAIENKKPPAVRPDGVSGVESTLWDLFERCWSIEPTKRPDSQAMCDYLLKNRKDLIATIHH